MERGVTGHIAHSGTFWFCWFTLIFSLPSFSSWWERGWKDRSGDRQTKREKTGGGRSLLHGLLVFLVCADILAGLFALLAPLALLVFVPSVAVAFLAVVPPPAAAA